MPAAAVRAKQQQQQQQSRAPSIISGGSSAPSATAAATCDGLRLRVAARLLRPPLCIARRPPQGVTGRELWRERVEGKFFSSPVSNGKAIYICDREGRLWTFSKEKFEVLGSFDLGAPVCATPALALGAMYVRTAEELICLGPEGRK